MLLHFARAASSAKASNRQSRCHSVAGFLDRLIVHRNLSFSLAPPNRPRTRQAIDSPSVRIAERPVEPGRTVEIAVSQKPASALDTYRMYVSPIELIRTANGSIHAV
jgi:hypothetical protein